MTYDQTKISIASYALICLIISITGLTLSNLSYAKVTINYTTNNGSDTGFYDNTAVSPVGGNTGTTLGEQRRIAFEYALDILSQTLSSDVTINVLADFNSNICGDISGSVLACAGPGTTHLGFAGALSSVLHYPQALANKIMKTDLCAPEQGGQCADLDFSSDVIAEFAVDTPVSIKWYYGLDANPGNDQLDFITVALHEVLHGLGFISLSSPSSYYYNESLGVDIPIIPRFDENGDIYSYYLSLVNGNPTAFLEMNDVQRGEAATSTRFDSGIALRWSGPAATRITNQFSVGVSDAQGVNTAPIYAPLVFQQGSSLSHVSTLLTPDDLMEQGYAGANHSLGLGAAFLSDIGWGNYTDLSINLIETFDPMPITNHSEYWLVVSNNGASAEETTVEYTLPSNTTLMSASPPQGSCSETNGILSCILDTVNGYTSLSIPVVLSHSIPTNITHSSTLYGNIVEASITNNTHSETTELITSSVNVTASAGIDINTTPNQTIILDASNSTATAGISSYEWTQIAGTRLNLTDTTSSTLTFDSGSNTSLFVFVLTVTDSSNHTAHDTVSVLVNDAPIANAGADQSATANTVVTLDGNNSSDNEGISTYSWEQISGTTVTLNNSNNATATFTAPNQPDTLEFRLTVTDGVGVSTSDTTTITTIANLVSSGGGGGSLHYPIILMLFSLWLFRRHLDKND